MSSGSLFVISAPSGAGKTTLLQRVMPDITGLYFSVSHTTRAPRAGEQDGRDYHFVSPETFQSMKAEKAFLEWAEVHNNFYGTSRNWVEEQLAQGRDIILDIDVQGALQVRNVSELQAVSIFIMPPSFSELEKRLLGRATDSSDTIATRLANAKREMREAGKYDHLIINEDLDEAALMLKAVILAQRSKDHRDFHGKPIIDPTDS